jgi:cyclohexanone monooxygenase
VISNVVVSIEQHVEFIADLLAYMRDEGLEVIEADQAAEDAWSDHVLEVAAATLFSKADSWWLGANIPGKPRVFTAYAGGVNVYRAKCDAVAAAGYEGFHVGNAGREPESIGSATGAGEGDR